ncbi:hypothetical protein [Nocardiopsis sp. CNT-189]|uniref:hypothetical protein n=1 Tax=Nocardiopsis oceanisediminis TaxID=2816862 RepID=UPI003B3BB1EC
MDSRSGLRPAPRAPTGLDRRLGILDRLHRLWCERHRNRAAGEGGEALRPVFERHVRELRALAGRPGSASRSGLDADALCALADEDRSGRLTAGHLGALARRIPDFDPPLPGPERVAAAAAEAASSEEHPVLRAARSFLETSRAMGGGEPPAPHLRPLPWALASLSLLRAGYPPLAADRRIGGRLEEALAAPEALPALAEVVADLATAELRARLSGPAGVVPPQAEPPLVGPLAAAMHRRVHRHLRHRTGPIGLVLREVEPGARVSVSAADTADGAVRERCAGAAERALFTPGPECRWVRLELCAAEREVELLVTVHDVGDPPSGALAVTAGPADVLDAACTDCVTLLPGDSADERWPAVEAFVDDAVSRVLDRLTRSLA